MIVGWKKTSVVRGGIMDNGKIVKEIKKGKAKVTQTIPFGKFPMAKWHEWNEDCEKSFNGTRWFKAYSDHLKAKGSIENEAIWKKLNELEVQLNFLTEQPEQEEGPVNLHGEPLGGKEHE